MAEDIGFNINPIGLSPTNLEEIFDRIEENGFHAWLISALTDAYIEARKGKRATHDMHEFELNWQENILNLAISLEERIYEPGSSIAFVIFDPKVREIFAAPARDRSAHHLLYSLGAGWWDQTFVQASTSCRVGRGTLYAISMAQYHMREVTNGYKNKAMVAKLDLRGYFMSLPREELCRKVLCGIDRQFKPYRGRSAAEMLYVLCRFLWSSVLKDDPIKKARKRGPKSHWDPKVLPPNKSLYSQEAGFGIVIGNLTSQLASNIYLDRLDKFITENLGYKYYGRYVDDFYIMVPIEKYAKLKRDIHIIESFLKRELGLILHKDKRYIQSVYKGMPYLGARVYPHCKYPSDRMQNRFRRAVMKYDRGIGNIDSVISYLGHMRHLDAEVFVKKVFREFDWNYMVYLESLQEPRRPMRDLVEEMARKI